MKKHHRTIRIIYFTVLILGSFLVGVMISAFNLEGTIRQVVYWGLESSARIDHTYHNNYLHVIHQTYLQTY